MNERVIRADGIEFATEAFGDPAHPPVLLIMGAMASMFWWPDEFCEHLANRRRHVVRYDNRDTGRSTTQAPGRPAYTLDDMTDDAIRVLDAYGLLSAHLVGMSLGGMIGQLAALKHPARVASLTAIGSSPFGEENPDLPGVSPAILEHFARAAELNWSNRSEATAFFVEAVRLCAGSAHPFDEARATQTAERDYDRARNYQSMMNHTMLGGGEAWQGRLHELRAPLLVVHGTADPVFPIEHGVGLFEAVANAAIVRLEGTGHELHEAAWDDVIAAIVDHTGRQPAPGAHAE